MSIADIATVVMAAVTCLSILVGGTWWASALFAKVKSIASAVTSMQGQLQSVTAGQQLENQKLWEAFRKLERELLLHISRHQEGGS